MSTIDESSVHREHFCSVFLRGWTDKFSKLASYKIFQSIDTFLLDIKSNLYLVRFPLETMTVACLQTLPNNFHCRRTQYLAHFRSESIRRRAWTLSGMEVFKMFIVIIRTMTLPTKIADVFLLSLCASCFVRITVIIIFKIDSSNTNLFHCYSASVFIRKSNKFLFSIQLVIYFLCWIRK